MTINIPETSLVILIGASGAGKTTFAHKHFRKSEVVSSDQCRELVSDDAAEGNASRDAFDLLHYIAAKRLTRRRLTVVDATNVHKDDRASLLQVAADHHVPAVAIVLDTSEEVCRARNAVRTDRNIGKHVVRAHRRALRQSLKGLSKEGFRQRYRLGDGNESDQTVIERVPMRTNHRHDRGPFDIIGDVHGCYDELRALLDTLGYDVQATGETENPAFQITHPANRRLIFVGDLVDRGPNSPDCLRIAMAALRAGGLWTPGNHDDRLRRKLRGANVGMNHGLLETMSAIEKESDAFRTDVSTTISALVHHYELDDGKLVVAHAGMKPEFQGRTSPVVKDFALYGQTTGETDGWGLPVRLHEWAAEYRGFAHVVYGHTATAEAEWVGKTICIDTGCVFGGKLTALRYPEKEIVSVPANRTWEEPRRPLEDAKSQTTQDQQDPAADGRPTTQGTDPNEAAQVRTAQQAVDDVLNLSDITGKRTIRTQLFERIRIRAENAAGALETMTRFSIDPKWLVYLPPTMSPCQVSSRAGILEHPDEALEYYRQLGIQEVVCQEKHMGSRAILIVCRDEHEARKRFGTTDRRAGCIHTRTGRPFFDDRKTEQAVLQAFREAWDKAGLWDELSTTWSVIDTELMPWSAKAKSLIENHYRPVGTAAAMGLNKTIRELSKRPASDERAQELLTRTLERREATTRYTEAASRYQWPVESPKDLRMAPFHVLATEGRTHNAQPHAWHMALCERMAEHQETIVVTRTIAARTNDPSRATEVVRWWEEITAQGGEGMVVKPEAFTVIQRGRPIQPAIKCRGQEYLRIIYGPEYTLEPNLTRLRTRNLERKRRMAVQEFALGWEALQRFVDRQPLRHVHECVFGVLALEAEPVDPRL